MADVKRFEFSGHNSRSELFEILDRVKGNPKVLTVHGDERSCTKFAEEIREKYGYDAKAPDIGDIIQIWKLLEVDEDYYLDHGTCRCTDN